jgi:hypothetical protein
MLIVKPDSLPRFWWLFPWSVARQLHKNAVALRALADRQDAVIREQADLAVHLNIRLKTMQKVVRLAESKEVQS